MKIIRATLWGLPAVFLSTSCAPLIPPVSSAFTPNEKTSVLYARLNLEHHTSLGNHLALWLRNLDSTNSFYIYFDQNQPVYAITVNPGHYRIMGCAGIDVTHRVLTREVFHMENPGKGFVIPFQVPAHTAVYIGDFTGYAKVNLVAEEWSLKFATNDFAQTTINFRQEYPNLASLPTASIFESQP
jgi:hypothetical protein